MTHPFMALFMPSLLVCLLGFTDASSFLGAKLSVSIDEVKETLLLEMQGSGKTARLAGIEKELLPMFKALSKTEHGTLEMSTVRFALHRYFVQKHGWYVKGLRTSSHGVESGFSNASIVVDRAPAYIQNILLEKSNGKGLGIAEVAVFAATMIDLIHQEATRTLDSICTQRNIPKSGPLTRWQSDEVIRIFIEAYIFGEEVVFAEPAKLKVWEEQIVKVYPTWPDTYMWFQDLRMVYDRNQNLVRNPFVDHEETFETTVEFAIEVSHQFGAFQKRECLSVKNDLVELESEHPGRVKLANFYSSWHFMEKPEYLRNQGALDETDPLIPNVMIANYINSPTNCLTASDGFFGVCCADECESHMVQLERIIAAPEAPVAQLVEGVKSVMSSLGEPQNITTELMQRLHEVAEFHHGVVPLHGRLFAQWMHYAFPRECAFPHISGEVNPMQAEPWMEMHGFDDIAVTKKELRDHRRNFKELESLAAKRATNSTPSLPWTMVEELVEQRRGQVGKVLPKSPRLPMFAGVLALVSFALPLYRASKVALQGPSEEKSSGVMV